jgi:putative Mg2+ transporter-C (MgtC) family protein
MTFKEILFMLLNSTEAEIIFRVLLAVCFSALIGLEREHAHRPAGLRTHILVCVGACLVMLTSEYIYKEYRQFSPNIDVARLGAQVISGIGFLGAGTIIRNGSSVKGLTTAASIWAVACVGLATGIGYYSGAIITTFVMFLILAYFKSLASSAYDHSVSCQINMKLLYSPELINQIQDKFTSDTMTINNIRFKTDKDNVTNATFYLSMNENADILPIIKDLYSLDEIMEIEKKYSDE